jgi:hypothetical protein
MVIKKIPLPIKILKYLIILAFVIYIPISILRNDILLLSLDFLVFYGVLLTLFNPLSLRRVFAGNIFITLLIGIYVLMVLVRLTMNIDNLSIDLITAFRNLLFGVGVFIISSAWITKKDHLDYLIKTFNVCIVLAAFYGLRQLLFGYFPFELNRLAMMGSSVQEIEALNRIRITSSFGDPLVFGFYSMVGFFALSYSKRASINSSFSDRFHPFFSFAVIVALIFTLTRAPLLGLVVGYIFFFFMNNRVRFSHIIRFIKILGILVLFILALDYIVINGLLDNSTNPLIIAINNGLQSLWSLFEFALNNTDNTNLEFLTVQSQNDRLDSWAVGLQYLSNHPFGAGLKPEGVFSFSIGDVGLLSIGLQIGIFGALAIIGVMAIIGIKTLLQIRNIKDAVSRIQGYLLVSIWLAIIVTSGISSILDSSVSALLIWTIAGILVRFKSMCTQQSLENEI